MASGAAAAVSIRTALTNAVATVIRASDGLVDGARALWSGLREITDEARRRARAPRSSSLAADASPVEQPTEREARPTRPAKKSGHVAARAVHRGSRKPRRKKRKA
jgi:hypothetical protein